MNKALLKKFTPNNLFESFKVLKFITIFNGLLPFNLSKDGKTVRYNKISIVIFIVHYLFFLVCFIHSLEESHQINETFFKSHVSNFVSITHRITSCSGITSLFILFIFLRGHYKKLLQLFVDVEGVFRSLSVKVRYQDITNLTVYITSGIFVFKLIYNVSCTVFFGTHSKPSFIMQVVFILPSAFKWIYIFVFIILVYTIKIFLKSVNQVRFLFSHDP